MRVGWTLDRQRGSHLILVRAGVPVNLSIPNHDELGPGILRAVIRKSGMTVEEFQRLLDA